MPRVCTVCGHPERAEIDAALVAREASNRRIASQYGVSERAVRDHKANHLKARMLEAAERNTEADIRTAIDVVGQLRLINGMALQVLKEARTTNNGDLALKAVDRIQRQLELQAKLIGDLSDGDTVNIIIQPEWVQVRSHLMTALRPYPDARLAASKALASLEVRHVA